MGQDPAAQKEFEKSSEERELDDEVPAHEPLLADEKIRAGLHEQEEDLPRGPRNREFLCQCRP